MAGELSRRKPGRLLESTARQRLQHPFIENAGVGRRSAGANNLPQTNLSAPCAQMSRTEQRQRRYEQGSRQSCYPPSLQPVYNSRGPIAVGRGAGAIPIAQSGFEPRRHRYLMCEVV